MILDVLHYNDYASQERILARVRAALAPGGVLLMRIGDADGGPGFTFSKAVDHTVALARRGRWTPLKCRGAQRVAVAAAAGGIRATLRYR